MRKSTSNPVLINRLTAADEPRNWPDRAVPEATGLGNNYYNLPPGVTEIQDLIEYKGMSFSVGNIFKACYRLGQKPHTPRLYDLQKIKWFVEREIQLEKGKK